MKVTYLIILFIFVIKFCGLCQPTKFNLTFNFGSTLPSFGNIINKNNEIFVSASIKRNNPKILLCKYSYAGTLIDSAVFGINTGNYYPGNIIFTSNNSLSVLCSYEQTPSYIVNQYILETDTEFVQLKDSLYSLCFRNFWGNAKINNNYYFAGNTHYNSYGDSLPSYNILFWKTDENLDSIFTKSYGIYSVFEGITGRGIVSGFDFNLIIGGVSLAINNQQDWYIINVDTIGQVLGEYYYGNSLKPDVDGIKSITLGTDSTYFLSGLNYKYDFGPGNYYYGATVIKLDRQFNTLWTKQIGSTVKGVSVSKLVSTSDGNQAILTQRIPVGLFTSYYSQVTKFNNNGNILWSRNYYNSDTTQYIRYRAWDMIETSDKGFTLCGSAIDTFNVGPDQEAWLVKTDSLGCDGLRSCNDTALVCQILQAPDSACKNDTAWLQVKFKGRSAPYFVYANTMLALDSVYYPYTLPLWIDTLVPYVPTVLGMQQVIIKVNDPWGWYNTDTVQIFVKNCGTGSIAETWYPKKVEIFPNPATNELHVKIRTTITTPITITIYTMQGKQVKQISTKQNESVIDISELGQGVYGVRVVGKNINCNEQFVKM